MRPEQLAINSISTRQSSFEKALEAYAGAGFIHVECHLPLVKAWLSGGRATHDLRALLESYGLRCLGGFESPLICFGSRTAMESSHELLLRNAELLHELGGRVMVIGTDGPPTPSMGALEVVAERVAALAEAVHGLDIAIALEFNWSPLVRSLASAVRVRELAAHSQVGVLFDPAHYHTTPTKLEDLTSRTVRWIKHVHLDDMRDKPPDLSHPNDDRVLPGTGVLDLRAIIGRLESEGYQGHYSIELFSEDLWHLPASEAALRCYASALQLCQLD